MTRKIFSYQEVGTNDDMDAIVDDIVMTQVIAVTPFSLLNTAITSKVLGDPDVLASDGSDALLFSLKIAPLRGDHIWIRYESSAPGAGLPNFTVLYRFYSLSGNELVGEDSVTHAGTAGKTDQTDVVDLSAFTADPSGIGLLMKAYAYWDSDVVWFDAWKKETWEATNLWIELIARDDGGIYLFGDTRNYVYWEDGNDVDSWSDVRNDGAITHSGRPAYHPGYGLLLVGDYVSGSKSGKIRHDVNHYTDDANSTEVNEGAIPGLHEGVLSNFTLDVCRNGNEFICVLSDNPVAQPYTSNGSLLRNWFRTIGFGTPAWESAGSVDTVLNGPGTDTWVPESDSGHPGGSGLDPDIIDVWVESSSPDRTQPGHLIHYFVRFDYDDTGTHSQGALYQYGDNEYELIDELNSWYAYGATTYVEYGCFAPAVQENPFLPALAVWEHEKHATDDHDFRIRVLRRTGATGSGVWTWETVQEWAGLSDSVASTWNFTPHELGRQQAGGYNVCDYGFDIQGNEHLAYARYDSVSGRIQVYYRFRNNSADTPTWTAEEKISLGTDWDNFKDAGQTPVWQVSLLKNNSRVPWQGPELRVAWKSRRSSGTHATFVSGKRSVSGEDVINVYAPEVFMNDRDATAGPKDMLWP